MDKDLRKQLDQLTVTIDVAGKVLGLGRNSAYAAAQSGQIPTLRIGRRILVPTAPLRRMLGLQEKEIA